MKHLPAMQEPQETRDQSPGQEDPLGEGTAVHCSVLAWRTPRTEEPGGLQSLGSQRVGCAWSGWAPRSRAAHSTSWGSFPGGAVVKNLPTRAGDSRDSGLTPGPGRSLGGGHSNPFQASCLGNPTDRGAWWAAVPGVERSQTWRHNWPGRRALS